MPMPDANDRGSPVNCRRGMLKPENTVYNSPVIIPKLFFVMTFSKALSPVATHTDTQFKWNSPLGESVYITFTLTIHDQGRAWSSVLMLVKC